MTFSEWYAANVEPTLPTDVPEPIRQNARESMAACWNAAIGEAESAIAASAIPGEIYGKVESAVMSLYTRNMTIKFDGEMQRLRQ